MKFTLKAGNLLKTKTDCLILGLYEKDLTPSAKACDKASKGALSRFLKRGDFEAKLGETWLLDLPSFSARILLVGCGKKEALHEGAFRKITFSAIKSLETRKIHTAISFLTDIDVKDRTLPWKIKHHALTTFDALYRFDQFKSKKEPKPALSAITFYLPEANASKACHQALTEALSIAKGVEFTKNLGNLPSNICTPTYLANEAQALSKQYKSIKLKILEEKDMRKLGMGALLAVAKGSATPPKLICLEYTGTQKKTAPVALVGKGITFDTGGVSLKPADSMVGMKYDMCGAATVLGTFKAAADLKLPMNLVGILAAAENMPSGTACKPEDIVTSLSGQTIEIMNTDAEGRLVLCDALTYCERYKPDTVIDIATLTGAVVIALGTHATGLLANQDALATELLRAGTESHDRAWQMPLWEEYQEQLKSPFADMSNVGGRSAGTITAACFLSRFAKKFQWAHLDVAGTAAMMFGNDRYATGRPVPLLMQFLINRCKKNA